MNLYPDMHDCEKIEKYDTDQIDCDVDCSKFNVFTMIQIINNWHQERYGKEGKEAEQNKWQEIPYNKEAKCFFPEVVSEELDCFGFK